MRDRVLKRLGLICAGLICGALCSGARAFGSDCCYGGGFANCGYSVGGLSITLGSPYIARSYSSVRRSVPFTGAYLYDPLLFRQSRFDHLGPSPGGYYSDGSLPVWRDTSRFYFVPGGFVPFGHHLEYVPARYEYLRSGYWDR